MPQQEAFIRVVGITKQFPGVLALNRVSMEVAQGEVHALVGENGAGKSTLIKILTGALPQDAGEIFIDGRRVEITDPHRAVQLGISAIFQEPSLVPSLSVEDNVLLGREPSGRLPALIDKRQLREQAQALLDQLGLKIDSTRRVGELSQAHQQLVAIAKALSVDARLIIMDEPSSALTAQELNYLFAVIRDLRAREISVIYVSHRLEEVFAIADTVSVLRDGQYIGTRSVASTTRDDLVHMIVGREVKTEIHPRRPPSDEVMLAVEGISRRGAFSDVTFVAHRGEVVALTGLVGSGRTDVVRALFGADPVDEGEIRILGQSWRPNSPQDAIRMGMSMVPEDRKEQGLIPRMSLKSNVTLSNLLDYCRWALVDEGDEKAQALQHVNRLRIVPPDLQRPVMYLSGGNQQKVLLAKALETKAEIVILDEPTAGIDIGAKAEIRAIISELADRGCTILLISSEVPEVLMLADRVLVMHEGRLVGTLRRDEVSAELILRLAMGEKLEIEQNESERA